MPQALILAGDHYHDARDAFAGVGAALAAAGVAATGTVDFAAFDAQLAGTDLLVIHRDGLASPDGRGAAPAPWMRPAQERALERFVLGGGGFLALHNAAWAYPWRGGYRRTLGGYYLGHPPPARFRVAVVDPAHPVTAGVPPYELEDEQHWLYWDFDRVAPLLVSQGRDGRQSVCGWAHAHGRGRVVYLPHGHTRAALLAPPVQSCAWRRWR